MRDREILACKPLSNFIFHPSKTGHHTQRQSRCKSPETMHDDTQQQTGMGRDGKDGLAMLLLIPERGNVLSNDKMETTG